MNWITLPIDTSERLAQGAASLSRAMRVIRGPTPGYAVLRASHDLSEAIGALEAAREDLNALAGPQSVPSLRAVS